MYSTASSFIRKREQPYYVSGFELVLVSQHKHSLIIRHARTAYLRALICVFLLEYP